MRQSALTAIILLHLTLPFASAVSLEDFQGLTGTVTVSCIAAYEKNIPGCTANDFEKNNQCSASCVAGLNVIQSDVQASCHGAVTSGSTLLGKIFNSLIISALCPSNSQSTSTTAKQTPTSSVAKASASSAAKTSPTPSTATAASSSSSSAPSSSASAAVPSSSSTSNPDASAVGNLQPSSTSSPAPAQASTAQSSNPKPKLTVQQAQIAALQHSGGGSPFDIVGYSSASRPSHQSLGLISTAVALLCAGILLAR